MCNFREPLPLERVQDDVEAVREALKAQQTNWIAVVRLVQKNRKLLSVRQRYRQYTILHSAAAEGKAEYVALFLSLGSDPNAKDAFGFTPLAAAASSDVEYGDVVSVLLRHSAVEAFSRCGSRGTPLHSAALRGHSEICRLLLGSLNEENVGMLRLKDWRGCNALQVAREHGKEEAESVIASVFRAHE